MKVRITSPKKIDGRVKLLAETLGLEIDKAQSLKQRRETRFEPELDNCHINNLVKTRFDGGRLCYGWVVGQDKTNDIVEAHFYSVWQGEGDTLVDITPRPTNDRRLLFVPDPVRKISFASYAGRPAISTYDVVRMHKGEIVANVREKLFIPYSELIYQFGFATKKASA
ncbi:MAG TPA: hypothetical protein ENK35_01035 [Candidatus Tenderia sp.]|nr:hypothetical protein [Candidatus Tenderia sp.]